MREVRQELNQCMSRAGLQGALGLAGPIKEVGDAPMASPLCRLIPLCSTTRKGGSQMAKKRLPSRIVPGHEGDISQSRRRSKSRQCQSPSPQHQGQSQSPSPSPLR